MRDRAEGKGRQEKERRGGLNDLNPRTELEKEEAQKRRTGGTEQIGTGGQNLPGEDEAALRYRLQMAAITWTRARKVADEHGKQMAEMLRGIAETTNVLLSGRRVVSRR